MTLGGLSVYNEDDPTILKVNRNIDMTFGSVDALYVTVGFTGSITPRLVVRSLIQDSVNPAYYWDVASGVANMQDIIFEELNRLASLAVYVEDADDTESGKIFGAVSSNKNATVSDYMNALQEIQNKVRNKVRAKYRMLKLE